MDLGMIQSLKETRTKKVGKVKLIKGNYLLVFVLSSMYQDERDVVDGCDVVDGVRHPDLKERTRMRCT